MVRSGRLVAEDAPAALGGGPVVIVLRCDRPSAAVRLLQEDPAVASVAVDGSVVRIGLRAGTAADPTAAALNGTLVAAGVAVYELATEQHGLEAAFFDLTGVPA